MPLRLSTSDPDFAARFDAFLTTKREASADVDAAVRAIIADVRDTGDAALVALSKKFDAVDLGAVGIRVSEDEIEASVRASSAETLEALAFARDRIVDHHQRHLPASETYEDALGVHLGHRWTPVGSAGLYVPGGLASYPVSYTHLDVYKRQLEHGAIGHDAHLALDDEVHVGAGILLEEDLLPRLVALQGDLEALEKIEIERRAQHGYLVSAGCRTTLIIARGRRGVAGAAGGIPP